MATELSAAARDHGLDGPAVAASLNQLNVVLLALCHLHVANNDLHSAIDYAQQLLREHARLATRRTETFLRATNTPTSSVAATVMTLPSTPVLSRSRSLSVTKSASNFIPDPHVLALMGRMFVQLGDVDAASALFQHAETSSAAASAARDMDMLHPCQALRVSPLSPTELTLNRALLCMVQHQYAEAFALLASILDVSNDTSTMSSVATAEATFRSVLVSNYAVAASFSNNLAVAVTTLEQMVYIL